MYHQKIKLKFVIILLRSFLLDTKLSLSYVQIVVPEKY
jgi:hypothetical protein